MKQTAQARIAKRFFTKDNFWNLMYWAMVAAAGFLVGSINEEYREFRIFILTGALIIITYFIKRMQGVVINSDNVFINSAGEKLDSKYPKYLIWVIFLNIALISGLADKVTLPESVPMVLAACNGSILFLPMLYFIMINCPVSLIFNSKAWSKEVCGFEPNNQSRPFNNDTYAHPVYSFLPGNIYHSRHIRRLYEK